MFCFLAPEKAPGRVDIEDSRAARNGFFSSASVKRASSAKVTRRERIFVRAQDIFTASPERNVDNAAGDETSRPLMKRSSTVLTLEKSLPKIPELSIKKNNDEEPSPHALFEGPPDLLAFIDGSDPFDTTVQDVPRAPGDVRTEPDMSTTPTPSPSLSHLVRPAPSEEEWLSSAGRHSFPSTAQAPFTDKESPPPHRGKGGGASSGSWHASYSSLSRGTSASAKTVTPMSSIIDESDHATQPLQYAYAATAEVPPIIDEVSESEQEAATPRQGRIGVGVCSKCGGHVERIARTAQLQLIGQDLQDSPTMMLQVSHWRRRAIGPSLVVKDKHGRRYALYPRTSYYEPLEEKESEEDLESAMPETFAQTLGSPDLVPNFGGSWPVGGPENPIPDAYTRASPRYSCLPAQPQGAAGEDLGDWACPSPAYTQNSDPIYGSSPAYNFANTKSTRQWTPRTWLAEEQQDVEKTDETRQSFWNNPEGVIVVYQGVELDGKEEFYGSDINYLGSYYDDEEGSSGLGSHQASTAELSGTGSGLDVIAESPDFVSCGRRRRAEAEALALAEL